MSLSIQRQAGMLKPATPLRTATPEQTSPDEKRFQIKTAFPSKTVCLFANIGTGHLNPMLALAARLTELGWRVRFYAHANARERVLSTGAIWCHYGHQDWDLFETAKRATRELLSLNPDALMDASIVSAGLPASIAMLPYLLEEICQHRPAFTVHDAAAPWGALAGRLAGLPTVCCMSAFPMNRSQALNCYPPGSIQLAAVRHLLNQYGLNYDVADTYLNYTQFNLVFTSAHWAGQHALDSRAYFCGPTPIDNTPRQSDHPAIQTAQAAKEAGKKVIYASFGTVVSGTLIAYYGETVYHIFSHAAQALVDRDDVHLILSSGRRSIAAGRGRNLPLDADRFRSTSISFFDYVPQPQLLEYADVFLTHAGMNSTNEALWFGVPVVCCPFFGDGHLNAQRFAELGLGISIVYGIATPAQVVAGYPASMVESVGLGPMRSALFNVLDNPAYRAAAAALKQRFRHEMNLEASINSMLDWVANGDCDQPRS